VGRIRRRRENRPGRLTWLVRESFVLTITDNVTTRTRERTDSQKRDERQNVTHATRCTWRERTTTTDSETLVGAARRSDLPRDRDEKNPKTLRLSVFGRRTDEEVAPSSPSEKSLLYKSVRIINNILRRERSTIRQRFDCENGLKFLLFIYCFSLKRISIARPDGGRRHSNTGIHRTYNSLLRYENVFFPISLFRNTYTRAYKNSDEQISVRGIISDYGCTTQFTIEAELGSRTCYHRLFFYIPFENGVVSFCNRFRGALEDAQRSGADYAASVRVVVFVGPNSRGDELRRLNATTTRAIHFGSRRRASRVVVRCTRSASPVRFEILKSIRVSRDRYEILGRNHGVTFAKSSVRRRSFTRVAGSFPAAQSRLACVSPPFTRSHQSSATTI